MSDLQDDNANLPNRVAGETSLARRSGFIARRTRELAQKVREHDLSQRPRPQDAYDYYTKGLSQYNRGEYEWAIEDYDEAIRLNPQYAEAYYNRSQAYRAIRGSS